jgi:hypothetical protein
MDARHGYYDLTCDAVWSAKTCPHCGQRAASGHGWLFNDTPPSSPVLDTRTPIGEVFIHDSGDDCVILAESERPQSNQ